MSLYDIDFSAPIELNEIKRPFTVMIEESVARAFIQSVRSEEYFVRETVVNLMQEFVRFVEEKQNGS